ncbi:MAG: response regulator [Bacteroidota bacterium]
MKSILLVDDDDTTNFLNKFFIKQLDAALEVNVASNGKEAIDFLELHQKDEIVPCLLILDTNMPVMDGWEFLKAFGKRFSPEFRKKITVVMLTAVDTENARQEAMADGNVADTAQKPLSDVKFKVLIRKHFS